MLQKLLGNAVAEGYEVNNALIQALLQMMRDAGDQSDEVYSGASALMESVKVGGKIQPEDELVLARLLQNPLVKSRDRGAVASVLGAFAQKNHILWDAKVTKALIKMVQDTEIEIQDRRHALQAFSLGANDKTFDFTMLQALLKFANDSDLIDQEDKDRVASLLEEILLKIFAIQLKNHPKVVLEACQLTAGRVVAEEGLLWFEGAKGNRSDWYMADGRGPSPREVGLENLSVQSMAALAKLDRKVFSFVIEAYSRSSRKRISLVVTIGLLLQRLLGMLLLKATR